MSKSMKEVTQSLGLTINSIRYYEKVGILPAVARDENGHRKFSEKDLALLQLIKMMRTSGMSIKNLKHYIDLLLEGDSTIAKRKAVLEQQLSKLKSDREQLDRTIDQLERKIKDYEAELLPYELDHLSD